MRDWLKGGLIGGIILLAISLILSVVLFSIYFDTHTLKLGMILFFSIFGIIPTTIFGFFIGMMLFISIKRLKKENIYLIPILIMLLHFILTTIIGNYLSISLVFIFFPGSLILLFFPLSALCFQDCNFPPIIFIFVSSLILGFIAFIIVSIIRNHRIKGGLKIIR